MADIFGNFFAEKANYTFSDLVSNIGGKLGIVLGLSIADLILRGKRALLFFWVNLGTIYKKIS